MANPSHDLPADVWCRSFQKINDSYGHGIGGRVLQVIADTTRKKMCQKDILARFSGEEFAILLSETAIQDVLMIADRIRDKMQKEALYLKTKTFIFYCFSGSFWTEIASAGFR